ncbi:MAG: phosphoribosylformylglycinamidine cyclo-ligase [bacterium]|nr:phosphoribosylformylglycinamidine cyclo-ligase [bacterium]
MGITYARAGVDIDKGNQLVSIIKEKVKFLPKRGGLGEIGHFGGFYEIPKGYREPILVSSCDGVGTKVKLAQALNSYSGIGIDLVAMSVNDLVATGAKPLFFLDYLAFGRLNLDIASQIIDGIIWACEEAGCSLLGGETAEMPGVYKEEEFDLAGFAVGVVEKDEIITGAKISNQDIIIGLPSSGLHSNGFSLLRKVFPEPRIEFLVPTKIYVRDVIDLKQRLTIKGIAHITGGGLFENIGRLLPKGLKATIDKKSWEIPEIFLEIQTKGKISEQEMFRTFNMGIGMALIIPEKEQEKAKELLVIGRIEKE